MNSNPIVLLPLVVLIGLAGCVGTEQSKPGPASPKGATVSTPSAGKPAVPPHGHESRGSMSENSRQSEIEDFPTLEAKAPLTQRAPRTSTAPEDNWPSWRGPFVNGLVAKGNPPIRWSNEENLRWRRPLLGLGLSTPVVWKDSVFLTCAVAVEGGERKEERERDERPKGRSSRPWMKLVEAKAPLRFVVQALDLRDGTLLWERTACVAKPHEGIHGDGSWASNSAACDGERVVAFFGSRGLYCYDLAGTLQWKTDLGDMEIRMAFGEGASPALFGDTVLVQWDHQKQSFLAALDAKTGKERWRVDRDEISSWSSPVVVSEDGKSQVLANGQKAIRSYDLATGKLLWHCGGMTENVVPTPVVLGDMAYFASGFRGAALKAVRWKGATGDLDGTKSIVWSHDEATPYVPSPVVLNGRIYFLKGNVGRLSCLDAATGTLVYGPEILKGIEGVYASPVAVADRIYVLGRRGTTVVVKDGPTFEVLATNHLPDRFDASPVVLGDELLLRGHKHLFCIARP